MIKIRNLSKTFNNPILQNVNLDIKKGEAVVIIGGSGCGKSTLLRCINRLEIPDCGEVYIGDKDIHAKDADVDEIRKKMGMVYQSFNLFSHLNVLENIILGPMKLNGVPRDEAVKEAKELLRKVGMQNYLFHMPDSLSGGQKQRVAIARSMAMHPEVMLFDEPTSALDPTMVDEVENVIRNLVDSGMTSVIVTHEMRFAKNIASKVVFLAEKGVYEMGTPEEIFDNPKKKLTREFIYRSRMKEYEVDRNTDLYEVVKDLQTLIKKYDHSSSQLSCLYRIADELIYPLLEKLTDKLSIRCIASQSSDDHTMFITVPNVKEDPLESDALDEINLGILKHYTKGVFSKKQEDGSWTICIKL